MNLLLLARRAAEVCLVLALALACSPDQPLPFPNNPATTLLRCGPTRPCEIAGEVCNIAIAGGTCAPACSDDAMCESAQAGLVCHPQIGGQCAPKCDTVVGGVSGDRVCLAVAANTQCNAQGLCEPVPAIGVATVRVFSAVSPDLSLSLEGAASPLFTGLVQGALSAARYDVATSGVTLVFSDASGATLATLPAAFINNHDYTIAAYQRADGSTHLRLFDETNFVLAQGTSLLRYDQLLDGLAAVSVGGQSGSQPSEQIFDRVTFEQDVEPQVVLPGAATLTFNAFQGPTMTSSVVLVDGQVNWAITWGSDVLLPQTTLISPTGIIANP